MPTSFFPLHRRIVWLVVLFLLIGLIALYSATGVLGLQRHGSEFYFVTRQLACSIAGLFLMVLVSRVPSSSWRRYAAVLLGAQIFLVAATLLPGIGHHALGATRWLKLGPLIFQPSELAKITVTFYVAKLLAERHENPSPLSKELSIWWAKRALPIALVLLLIFRQPDLGTTVLLCLMMLGMFFLSGVRLVYLLGFLGTGAIGFVWAMLHYEYRRRRLFAFLNPWADPQGNGFQTIQSFLSFHSGHLFGVGLGNGNSKLFFLPEVHTDFIYALIGEELGFIGAITLLVLFIYFAYLLFKISFQSKEPFSCYLAFGLSLGLALQIAVNLGGVTGILPVKGLPLPFISWGRSALLVNLATMGILLNIVRSSAIIPAKDETVTQS